MNNLDQKYNEFKTILTCWSKATEAIFTLGQTTIVTEIEGECDELRQELDTIMLKKIRRLFEIPLNDVSILDDEWFWAEWDTSKECFYYVYGKTQMIRCKREMVLREVDVEWPDGDYLCVWAGGYTPASKTIAEPFAFDYFSEKNGFNETDAKEILELDAGDYWNGDLAGLVVYKG